MSVAMWHKTKFRKEVDNKTDLNNLCYAVAQNLIRWKFWKVVMEMKVQRKMNDVGSTDSGFIQKIGLYSFWKLRYEQIGVFTVICRISVGMKIFIFWKQSSKKVVFWTYFISAYMLVKKKKIKNKSPAKYQNLFYWKLKVLVLLRQTLRHIILLEWFGYSYDADKMMPLEYQEYAI